MNKIRIEALSDGVFAIVMTLLIIDIKVPHLGEMATDQDLWHALMDLWALLRSYLISYIVLGMYWIAHHAFFHMFAKNVNRIITNLNILFLMFTTFIPFSAHLLGEYPQNHISIIVYGFNIVCIGLTLLVMLWITVTNPNIVHEHVSKRLIAQATIRQCLPPGFALLAILVSKWNFSLSYFLFMFPVVFNIIPGGLDLLEKIFLRRKNEKGSE